MSECGAQEVRDVDRFLKKQKKFNFNIIPNLQKNFKNTKKNPIYLFNQIHQLTFCLIYLFTISPYIYIYAYDTFLNHLRVKLENYPTLSLNTLVNVF